ncbi:MAG TPA: hypothetical protein VFA18_03535 [Gemmataceae bacterium]|nr:hypothetical protein [Gemmataceae bacterium]
MQPLRVLTWHVRGIRIIHVPAGPPAYMRKEERLPFMEDFHGLPAALLQMPA